MAKVLVTGGAGFIGSHLVERLLAAGESVTVLDDYSTSAPANLAHLSSHERLTLLKGCAGEADLVLPLVGQADVVYHLAAAVGVALIAKEPLQTIERNVYPTQLLLKEASRLHEQGKPIRFFLASTSEVYGKNPKPVWNEEDDLVFGSTTRPRWSYGASKAIDEFLALACFRQYGLPVVIGRFFNVVGPRQSGAYGMVLPRFIAAAVAGKPLIVHDDGNQTRCFGHVREVVDAVLALMKTEKAIGRVFNIGSDQPISILDLAKKVIELCNSKSTIEFQTYTQAYDSDFEDIRHRVPDLTRLKETIGFGPRGDLKAIIEDCLRK
ncbi:MAG: GDP-mannose 4,6-dehydratase [Pirellulales bacterium]